MKSQGYEKKQMYLLHQSFFLFKPLKGPMLIALDCLWLYPVLLTLHDDDRFL